LIAAGVSTCLDGAFRLDCQGIGVACENDSWHSHARKIESGFTVAATFLALLILAVAFRRLHEWRGTWLPMLAVVPAVFVANAAFSSLGVGTATRAGTVVVFAAIAFLVSVCSRRRAGDARRLQGREAARAEPGRRIGAIEEGSTCAFVRPPARSAPRAKLSARAFNGWPRRQASGPTEASLTSCLGWEEGRSYSGYRQRQD
jgi:uncharacterized membrane protein YhaH (DUF805 family)